MPVFYHHLLEAREFIACARSTASGSERGGGERDRGSQLEWR
jgi:hypothetical protein